MQSNISINHGSIFTVAGSRKEIDHTAPTAPLQRYPGEGLTEGWALQSGTCEERRAVGSHQPGVCDVCKDFIGLIPGSAGGHVKSC